MNHQDMIVCLFVCSHAQAISIVVGFSGTFCYKTNCTVLNLVNFNYYGGFLFAKHYQAINDISIRKSLTRF
jgi:hypothetical protein